MPRPHLLAMLAFAVVALLVACSTTPAAPASVPAAPTPIAGESTGNYPLTVRDDRGEVVIPQRPQRIVTVSEETTELLLALGVQPAGVASSRHTATQPGERLAQPTYLDAGLLGQPVFLGSSEAPAIERIVALKPDLIVYLDYDEQVYTALKQIAPTLAFNLAARGSWQTALVELGKALGRETSAAQVVADFQARVAALRGELAPVVARTPRVALLYLPAADSTFVFNEQFAFGGFVNDLGFKLVVPAGADLGERGTTTISPESLAGIETDAILTLQFSEGAQAGFPVEPILASLDVPLLRTVLERERPYTGPYTERFYLESFAALLKGQ